MTIPNIITIMRLLLVPVVVFALVSEAYVYAFAGFLLAGVSDAVDGYIARRFNQHSELGAYLDPAADKLLLVSVFIVLGILRELPLWFVVLAVSRDALIIGAVLLSTIMSRPVAMKPLLVSKANTAVQIAIAAFVLGELAFGVSYDTFRWYLVATGGLLTVASAGAYLVGWLGHMNGDGNGPINAQ